MNLTLTILQHDFGFEILELADHWEAYKDGFVLLKPKSAIVDAAFFPITSETLKEYQKHPIETVQALQNFAKEINFDLKFTI